MFQKILIANRGEIGCRIIRTAQEMGVKCVAIYSEQDRDALHVEMADEAYEVGPPPAQQSYLLGEKIIEICLQSGCDGIHPGYGFLAENPEFAELCQKNDIVFIGPDPEVIKNLGVKSWAKKCVRNAGVPSIPDYHGPAEEAVSAAAKLGFPLLVKAERGGGGKGIRLVMGESTLEESIESVQREAQVAFGSSDILLEKYISPARHIEVQFFSDSHGNCVHLFERDCSLQRRHQKIIEESPAHFAQEQTREAICRAAIQAAQSMNYSGAGTVEFLVDENDDFYFMEINTRLQVEHPVTEMQTGFDLVEWQLLVASGLPLPVKQKDIHYNGHTIEARIYAENPDRQFLPSTGTISHLLFPQEDPTTRVDTGVRKGDFISPHYDPMVAKLIVHGESRRDARMILEEKLQKTAIIGVRSNITFLQTLTDSELFSRATYTTQSLDENLDSFVNQKIPEDVILLTAATFMAKRLSNKDLTNTENRFSPWYEKDSFRLNHQEPVKLRLRINETDYRYSITFSDNCFSVDCKNLDTPFSAQLEVHNFSHDTIAIRIEGRNLKALLLFDGDTVMLNYLGRKYISSELASVSYATSSDKGQDDFLSPMPGKIGSLKIQAGEEVKKGETLLTIEAMKMEHSIQAPQDGVVLEFKYKVGDSITEGAELLRFEAAK